MDWKQKLWIWIKLLLRMYEKEIKQFVIDILDLAYQNLDAETVRKITPQIRKQIVNKVLTAILAEDININEIRGKSDVSRLILDAIREHTASE